MINFFSFLGALGWMYILYAMFRREKRKQDRVLFMTGLLLKLACGLLLGWIYTVHYQAGDTFQLYHDGKQFTQLLYQQPLEYLKALMGEVTDYPSISIESTDRSLFFVKWISLFNAIGFDSYWVCSLYLSGCSFLGAWYLVRTIRDLYPTWHISASIAFLFLPSFVFWSAGVLKESLAVMSLMILSGVFVRLNRQGAINLLEAGLAVLSTYLVWNLKYYWGGLFFAGAVTAIFLNRVVLVYWSNKTRWFYIIVGLTVLVVSTVLVSGLQYNLQMSHILGVVVQNNAAYEALSRPDQLIHYEHLEPTWSSVLLNSPWALISGLFRPFIFESLSAFKIPYAMENLLLLGLTLASLFQIKVWKVSPACRVIMLCLLFYCLIQCVFLALSTPNFGTLSRYRIGFLPYFALLIIQQSNIIHRLTSWSKQNGL